MTVTDIDLTDTVDVAAQSVDITVAPLLAPSQPT